MQAWQRCLSVEDNNVFSIRDTYRRLLFTNSLEDPQGRGEVWVSGCTARRKRQLEFLAFLDQLDRALPVAITLVHPILDNLVMHRRKLVQGWLATHPGFVCCFPPVHCSWMNQVEQWFSILQRKRLRIVDFPSKGALTDRLAAFIVHWNVRAHPFNWSTQSVAKVMAACPADAIADRKEAA